MNTLNARKITSYLLVILTLTSCATHKKANIKAQEEFIIELKKPVTRGGLLEVALEGVFLGATFLAEKTSKSLTSSYSQSLSINNYYNVDLGTVEKTYNEIHIKKYSKPIRKEDKETAKNIIDKEISTIVKTRGGNNTLRADEIIREENDDLLNFHAVIELISDDENPGITRLRFSELRILFSKTRIYTDENLNAKIALSIEGQWRENNTPKKAILIEQEYDFKNLKYGYENQIEQPILSPWYYDIPISQNLDNETKFGVIKINIQLEEYEGKKSKYINKLPSILSDNKDAIINNGASTIKKVIDK